MFKIQGNKMEEETNKYNFQDVNEEKKDFRTLLNETYVWPAVYPFKFIISPDQLDELKSLLNDTNISVKPSKNGKYISVSTDMKLSSSDEVIYIYEKVKQIKNIIAL